jgi:hypothetical protein
MSELVLNFSPGLLIDECNLNRKICDYELNEILWKMKHAAHLKNAATFLVA